MKVSSKFKGLKGFIIIFYFLFCPFYFIFGEPPTGYVLRWHDEFEGNKLDENKWSYIWKDETRRNAKYVPQAVKVQDGKLKIAVYTSDYQTYSGAICTKDKFEYSYGYYEARVKFNDKSGMWSDFWLYSDTVATMKSEDYDIRNSGAEIDIFEHFAQDNYGNNLNDQVQHTVIWNKYGEPNSQVRHNIGKFVYTDDWHVIGFEWTPYSYKFFVDGQLVWETKEGLTSRPEYIILSTEVEDMGGAGKIPEEGYNDFSMEIEYVKIYSK